MLDYRALELKRAKGDPWWTTGPWKVVGRTYEIVDEPTSDTEVTGLRTQSSRTGRSGSDQRG